MNEQEIADYRRRHCPITRSMWALGDSWTLLIIREFFIGYRRFEDIRSNLEISKSVLSKKLQKLQEHGIIRSRMYQEEHQRPRKEYLLTEKGKGLYKVLSGLLEWCNEYSPQPEQEQLEVLDRESDQPVHLELISQDGQVVGIRDIYLSIYGKEKIQKRT